MPDPPRLEPRYRLLDAWRGFACSIVVSHHAGFVIVGTPQAASGTWGLTLEGGARLLYRRLDLGVPLFFVISGSCIAASMDAHRARGASSWRFLGRRIWRIYPPYWAAVLGFVIVVGTLDWLDWRPIRFGIHSLHLDHPRELAPTQWLGNLTLIETWRPKVFGGDPYKIYAGVERWFHNPLPVWTTRPVAATTTAATTESRLDSAVTTA